MDDTVDAPSVQAADPVPELPPAPGRAVLVTGGSRGLGLLLARGFAGLGCRVAVCARDRAELDAAVEDLRSRGCDAVGIACDLREPDEAERVVAEAADRFGRLDVVVNNAGVIQVGPAGSLEDRHFAEAMDLMFWAPLHISRAALVHLERVGGRLVTIGSIGGEVSTPHLLPYSCAKAAETALSEGLAVDARGRGVSVTTVVPGLMRTGSHRNATFVGASGREYAWFGPAASLPLLTISGERAAKQIITGTVLRRSRITITPWARAAVAARGISPVLTRAALRLFGMALPAAPEDGRRTEKRGSDAESTLVKPLTVLGDRAAHRNNQEAGPAG